MGFSVQLFETLAWAEELLEPRDRGRRPPPPPPLHRRPATRASPDGPRPRARTRTERPSWRPTPATTRASRATRRSSRRSAQVYCGDLDRYVELTGEVARALRQRAGLRPGRRTSTASSRRAGSRRRSRSPRSRSPPPATLGNPYWISYALWIAGHGVLQGRRAAGARGLGRGRRRSCASTASSSSRASSRATRRACTPPTASPRPRSVLFAEAIAAFQRAGNVPQLDHHAGQRAGAVRAARPPRRPPRRCSARCRASRRASTTCPSSPTSATASAATLGAKRAAELTAAGAALDLDDAAVYARQQIDVARRDPTPAGAPGAARRPEPARDRGAPPRGRRPDRRRDRDAAVHLDEDRRAPHPAHLHEDRRVEPRRGDPLGRRRTGWSTTPSPAEPARAGTYARKWVGLPMP